jgi:NtrC-family two-component system sensor histidine kinase KinB
MNLEVSPINPHRQQDEGASLALLLLVASEIHSSLDLDAVLHRVLIATIGTMDTPHGSLYVFDDLGNVTHRMVIRDWKVQEKENVPVDVAVEKGLAGWVIRNQRGTIVSNTAEDERWYSWPDELPRSAITVPLQTRTSVIGVLTLVHDKPGYFSDSDLAMLTVIADQATTAVVNARLYQAEQRRRQLAATLAEVSHTISATLDIDLLFDVILEQLARVIHYDSAAVLLQQDSRLQVVAARGYEDADRRHAMSPEGAENSPALRAMRQRQAIVIDDIQEELDLHDSNSSRQVRGWIGAPLMTQDEVFGVLTVDSRRARAYTQEDAQVVATFAHQAAIALTNARLVEQLQAAELRYARLFEDNTDMLLIFGTDGKVLDANRKACQTLHRDKESLVGLDVGALAANLATRFEEVFPLWRSGQEVVFEVDLPVALEHVVPVEFQTKCIDYGGADGIQWSGRDISARREVEQLRQDLTDMLVHDMRGPMGNLVNAISSMPLILGELPPDSPIAQLADIALRSGQQMQDLIDSMLDVSRLEQQEMPLNRTQGPVDGLMRVVEDQLSSTAAAKQVKLSFEVQGKLPVPWIDQDMIRRVLVNLVINAIKYSPRQGQVDVVASAQDGCINFSVSDQGPGVPAEYQWRIFDKFTRVQFKNGPSGVGLGLAFCRLAVEAHGGRIWVESTPGQGSTFIFTLPLVEAVQSPPEIFLEGKKRANGVGKDD